MFVTQCIRLLGIKTSSPQKIRF